MIIPFFCLFPCPFAFDNVRYIFPFVLMVNQRAAIILD